LAELSFIITRSDLLAPKKEQVDRLMPYLTQVLRDALGASGKDVRLGNVRCVSAKRGWWTQELRSEIWRRGGGGWMVGKVNVGKSKLFEVAFPKGRGEDNVNIASIRDKARVRDITAIAGSPDRHEDEIALRQHEETTELDDNEESLDPDEQLAYHLDSLSTTSPLLPPARTETAYPMMPTVSSLPGTTASPIRIPFGSGRGELVDLPGLARGTLDTYVTPPARDSLVMKHRVVPEQFVIKPGQALLLGGLVRIDNPRSIGHPEAHAEVNIMAYPFVPLHPHLTSALKADEIQSGERVSPDYGMVVEEQGLRAMRPAGKVQLKWDVTKQRAGPLTTAAGGALKVKVLPFRVFSADLLVEGVGWVELVAQVRKRRHTVDAVPALESTTSANVRDGEDTADSSSSAHLKPTSPETEMHKTLDRPDETPLAPPLATSLSSPSPPSPSSSSPFPFPEVTVFTPEGMGIDTRQPLGAWLLGGEKARSSAAKQKSRPRRSVANDRKGPGEKRRGMQY